MTITLLAHHIEWDTDGRDLAELGLPSKVEVTVDLNDDDGWEGINRQICDQLCANADWLVADYQLEGYDADAAHALEMKQIFEGLEGVLYRRRQWKT